MSVLDDLRNLRNAEDFFMYFRIEYDEGIVKPYRLHILKMFSLYMEEVLKKAEDAEDESLYNKLRECLIRAYQDFLTSDPTSRRLFKVHKEAIKSYLVSLELRKDNHGEEV
ncbi:MAG: nitrogenase-stabilizing/protective protein NifW [Aquificaceae bacterium]